MPNRIKRLLSLALMLGAVTIYWGCSQPADVVAPISSSEVTLSPQLLPSNFPGMHYELWVADSQDTLSLGKFGYDNFSKRFLEPNGSARQNGNLFLLSDNIYRFSKLFVSVEVDNDPSPMSPGPIMLIDDVTVPSNSAVDLIFPMSRLLWDATVRFNMETTSDSNRDSLDGYGVWFASYQKLSDSVRDTFSLDSFTIDSMYFVFLKDTVMRNLTDVSDIRGSDTTRIFGIDTFSHKIIRFDQTVQEDTAAIGDSVLVTSPTFSYTIGTLFAFDYDEFTQDSFALPLYTAYGWNYKGWVVSEFVSPILLGEITPPAWNPNSSNDSLVPGIAGGMLTTGTFSSISLPDDGNPLTMGPRVPPFPGEDFILSPHPSSWGGLVSHGFDNSGTVFISIEPSNFVTDTTNFPLIAFMAEVPSNRNIITDTLVIISMWNRTQTSDPSIGFPRIRVDIRAF